MFPVAGSVTPQLFRKNSLNGYAGTRIPWVPLDQVCHPDEFAPTYGINTASGPRPGWTLPAFASKVDPSLDFRNHTAREAPAVGVKEPPDVKIKSPKTACPVFEFVKVPDDPPTLLTMPVAVARAFSSVVITVGAP